MRHVRNAAGGAPSPSSRVGGIAAQRQRRPRQHAADHDRQVEPERPRVVEARRREPFEVVADEEARRGTCRPWTRVIATYHGTATATATSNASAGRAAAVKPEPPALERPDRARRPAPERRRPPGLSSESAHPAATPASSSHLVACSVARPRAPPAPRRIATVMKKASGRSGSDERARSRSSRRRWRRWRRRAGPWIRRTDRRPMRECRQRQAEPGQRRTTSAPAASPTPSGRERSRRRASRRGSASGSGIRSCSAASASRRARPSRGRLRRRTLRRNPRSPAGRGPPRT